MRNIRDLLATTDCFDNDVDAGCHGLLHGDTACSSRHNDLDDIYQRMVKYESESRGNFIAKIFELEKKRIIGEKEVKQCALEMLLAGTDTSSVTMFYALLGLSSAAAEDGRTNANHADNDGEIAVDFQKALHDEVSKLL